MKKILLLAILALPLIMGGAVFAENPVSHDSTKIDIVSGKVEKIILADPVKGIKSEVTVVTPDNAKVAVLVETNTTIYDTELKAIGLDKVKDGDAVKIKYTTSKEGVREARSLSLVK